MIRKILLVNTLLAASLISMAQTVNVTFEINAANITVDPNGLYIAGGMLYGSPGTNPLTDSDNDGIWTGTIQIPADSASNWTILNGNCLNWSCKENIAGQPCADASNFNDRKHGKLTQDTTIKTCFGECSTDGSCSTPKDQIDLPIDWEGTSTDYTVADFEGNTGSEVVVDPKNSSNMVLKSTKKDDAQPWAGTTLSTNAGLANAIPIEQGKTTMTVDVYSPDANIQVLLKIEDAGDPTKSVQTLATVTKANEWETLTFDFTNEEANTAPVNFSYTYDKVSIFYNYGVDGATAGEKTYYCDNVKFGSGSSPSGNMVTFQVDMNDYSGNYTNVHLNGSFNNWCGDCAAMTDDNSDGVYELEVDIANTGEIEYKFTVDNFTDEEKFAGGESCTKTTGQFTNRVYDVQGDATLPVVCWESCDQCGVGPAKADVTFKVDMSEHEGTFTAVNLNGTFNNWCGSCAVMTDDDNDDIYELTVTVDADSIEWLFTLDGWDAQETFEGGEACTVTKGENTNRVLVPTEDTTLAPTCWNSCNTCGTIGVNEISDHTLQVYPNPASEQLNLQFSETPGLIEMVNTNGQRVYETNVINGTNQMINVSHLPEGVYFIKATLDQTTVVKRVVVQ